MAEPNATNVFAGPTVLYTAPAGTAPPSLASQPSSATWLAAGFTALGYTDDGVMFTTTPTVKDITPDEVLTPVLQIVGAIKLEVKVKLLERHIENLAKVQTLSVLTNPGTGIKTLAMGSGNALTEFVLGFQGPDQGAPLGRVAMVWRAQVISGVSQHYMRKDVPSFDVTFSALTDSTKAVTRDVYEITDFSAGS